MKTYKNVTSEDLTVEGVGIVKAGETVEIEGDFNNANFELVTDEGESEKPKEETDNVDEEESA